MQQRSLPLTSSKSPTLTIGLALFSMFFGAGNLIFPLLIGQAVGEHSWFALIGLAITAVGVPFFGLITMVLFRGDYYAFFGRLGKIPGLFLLSTLLLILGPFGVIPRLVTLIHAIIQPYLLTIPLLPFSILLTIFLFGCCYKKEKLLPLLGLITPFLLLSMAILVFMGLTITSPKNPNIPSSIDSFTMGLVGGYNTMDLIAASVFASVIIPYFQAEIRIKNPKERMQSLLRKIIFPTLIAASLLFLTYCGLCWISANHGWMVDKSIPSEQLLHAIAIKLLGPVGGAIAAISVSLACLTTAISLTSIFADYLRKEICKEKIHKQIALLITIVITILFTNLGFNGISAFLSPILETFSELNFLVAC